MNKTVFISYANKDKDIVENLAGRLKEFNVEAWVYSRNKTLGVDAWKEIENKILQSYLFIYAISDQTPDAKGQSREVEIALNNNVTMFPLSIDEPLYHNLPESLKYVNGEILSPYTVKETALKIVNRFFQDQNQHQAIKWCYPIPGDWIKVIYVDSNTEEYLDVGDLLYFRKISPLGLFECYSPKLQGFFWIYHEHVVKYTGSLDTEHQNTEVPYEYSVFNMSLIEERAWRTFLKQETGSKI